MSRSQRLSREQLIQQCTQLDPAGVTRNPLACRELLRRAVCANDDRAWDALVPHLRVFLLRRIYEQRPEVNPQEAERLIFHTLTDFLTHFHRQPDLPRHFPTYPAILTTLDKSLTLRLNITISSK